MAERRMIARTITTSDAFCDMPASSRLLYYELNMSADDDGFVNNPKKITRSIGAADDDLRVLASKKFIIPFDSGIIVIKHWRIHNYIAKDRYHPTKYQDEYSSLKLDENHSYTLPQGAASTPCIQIDDNPHTEVRVGKDRLGEDKEEKKADTPPRASLPAEALALASLLSGLHIANIDSGKKPVETRTLESWARDIDKINRIDGRPWDDIERAIRWVKTKGCFWAPNILSGSKLREKFDTVYGQMKQGGSSRSPKVTERTTFLDMEEG